MRRPISCGSCAWLVAAALVAVAPAGASAGAALGVRAGLSVSGIRTEDDVVPESKLGPGAGLFLTVGMNDLFSVQPEVLFVSKGGSWGESEATDFSGNVLGTFETLNVVDYLEFPILFRLSLPVGGALHPVLSLGPAFAVELDEKLKTTGSVEQSGKTESFKAVDVGGAVGIGLELIGPGGIWSVDGRYTHGLADVEDNFYGGAAHNWNLLLSLGFARSVR